MKGCTVCAHKDAALISTRLLHGASLREVARRFALSKSSLGRHSCFCLAQARAIQAKAAARRAADEYRLHKMELAGLQADVKRRDLILEALLADTDLRHECLMTAIRFPTVESQQANDQTLHLRSRK